MKPESMSCNKAAASRFKDFILTAVDRELARFSQFR